jgi:hypothetical protein
LILIGIFDNYAGMLREMALVASEREGQVLWEGSQGQIGPPKPFQKGLKEASEGDGRENWSAITGPVRGV